MKTLLHPIFLFFIGSFIGLSPYIFGSSYFDVYHTFQLNNEILVVYLVGFAECTQILEKIYGYQK